MKALLTRLQSAYPALRFTPGNMAVWSPETQEVFYVENRKLVPDSDPVSKTENRDAWALLHETGHALLGHRSYKADFELIQMEIAAWRKARELGRLFDITIDEDHIQDCLDTYRDWLYRRSICPTCTTKCLQGSDYQHYRCHNCHTTWRVSNSRFTRPYRATKGVQSPRILFHASES